MNLPRASVERQSLGFSWTCYADFVHCPHEHLYFDYPTNYRVNRRQLNGPALMVCKDCQPASYYLAVFKTGHVSCYLITKDQHDFWDSQEQFPEIPELLSKLTDPEGRCHNPYFRPPKPREKR